MHKDSNTLSQNPFYEAHKRSHFRVSVSNLLPPKFQNRITYVLKKNFWNVTMGF